MRRWNFILSIVVVFAAGFLAGSAVTAHIARKHFLTPPRAEDMADRMMREYQSKLKLTPEQFEQIKSIILKATLEAEAYHYRVIDQFQNIFDQADEAVESRLSDEQKAIFENLKARRPKPPGVNDTRETSRQPIEPGSHRTGIPSNRYHTTVEAIRPGNRVRIRHFAGESVHYLWTQVLPSAIVFTHRERWVNGYRLNLLSYLNAWRARDVQGSNSPLGSARLVVTMKTSPLFSC